MNIDKYQEGRYLEGGRVWPNVDCYGIVAEVRRDLGLEPWSIPDAVVKSSSNNEKLNAMLQLDLKPCEPSHGVGAACYRGSVMTHAAIVIQIDGVLYAMECNPVTNVTILPIRRFIRKFTNVEFYQ